MLCVMGVCVRESALSERFSLEQIDKDTRTKPSADRNLGRGDW